MTLNDLLDLTRSLLRDTSAPYLWSDDLLTTYLNEAQEKIARATYAFVREDEALAILSAVDTYDLPDYVLMVFRVQLDNEYPPLGASTDGWTPATTETGRPTRYATDSQAQQIRFWPIPDQAYSAILRIARMPTALTLDDPEVDCELQARYQLPLADWAAFRCFTHDDADGRNEQAAQRAKARFDEAVQDHKQDLYKLRVGSATRVGGNRIK